VTCLNRGRDLGLRQDDQPTSRSEVLIRSGPVRVPLVNKRGLRSDGVWAAVERPRLVHRLVRRQRVGLVPLEPTFSSLTELTYQPPGDCETET
jgi:hypothetical protein